MTKTSFADSMKKKSSSPDQQNSTPPAPTFEAVTDTQPKMKRTQANRVDKSPLIAYVNKAFVRQIKQYCLDNDTTQQQVIIDALNEYFEKRQKAGIA